VAQQVPGLAVEPVDVEEHALLLDDKDFAAQGQHVIELLQAQLGERDAGPVHGLRSA
jgi:hypothetical protein